MLKTFRVLLLIGLLLSEIGVGSATAADDGDRKLLDTERTLIATGAAWGSIASLADGSLGVVYAKARPVSQTDGPNVALEWSRSTDGGLSWSQPTTLAERLGSGGQLYDVRQDGGYIVYERRNQAFGQLPSGRIVCSMVNLDYYYDSDGHAQQQNYLGSTFRYNGMSYCYSDNFGQTWSPLQSLSPGPFGGEHMWEPYRGASPHGEIVTLANGTALMAVYGSRDPAYNGPLEIPAGTTYMAGVLRSTDNGLTWGDPSLIMTKSSGLPYEETGLCRLPGDRLLAAQRTPTGSTVQYDSTDLGRTWSGPTPLTEPGGSGSAGQHPTDIIRLADGVLLAAWGNRRDPYGAMAMVSLDEGVTWEYDNRVSLAWDASGISCGYANAAQAGDGSIVLTYYDLPAGGADWSTGQVYAIRFTEQQFFDAAGLPYHAPEPSTCALLLAALVCSLAYVRKRMAGAPRPTKRLRCLATGRRQGGEQLV